MSDLPAGAIELRGVSRSYRLLIEKSLTLKETVLRRSRVRATVAPALSDVDLDITPGTALGVVGANGAGKSTLLKLIAGILPPDTGTIRTGGRVVSLLELGAGFHPDFSGRENVILNGSIHGVRRQVIEERMDSIVAFAELERYIDAPVRTYSSGMYARLGFAVAAELEPDILLLDEILAVGDAAFQSKCIARIADFQRAGVTIVFVSHSSASVELVCNRAVWIGGGHIQADGPTAEVLDKYHRSLHIGRTAGEVVVEADTARPAQIVGVGCLSDGRVSDRFLTNDAFSLAVDYDLRESRAVVVAIAVRAADGTLLGRTDDQIAVAQGDEGVGRHRVTLSLQRMPLLDGVFSVDVTLRDSDGTELHRVERAVEFTVFASGRGEGPVAFLGDWHHEAVAVAE